MSLKDDMEFGRLCCVHETSKTDEERIYELESKVAGVEWAIKCHELERYMFIVKIMFVLCVVAALIQIGVAIGRVG